MVTLFLISIFFPFTIVNIVTGSSGRQFINQYKPSVATGQFIRKNRAETVDHQVQNAVLRNSSSLQTDSYDSKNYVADSGLTSTDGIGDIKEWQHRLLKNTEKRNTSLAKKPKIVAWKDLRLGSIDAGDCTVQDNSVCYTYNAYTILNM